MLLIITVPMNLQVRLHSDKPESTAKAHAYLRERMHGMIGEVEAADEGRGAPTLVGRIFGSISDADRVALAALGFSGIAVAQVFEARAAERPAAWCCTIGCENPATWSVVDRAQPYDTAETHTCTEHLADACSGVPGAVVTALG